MARTYCKAVDYVEKLSARINTMHDICPVVLLKFNTNFERGGSAVLMSRISDMYIELDIPHNYRFGNVHFACMLVHEYCHYIDALTMSGRERSLNIARYLNDSTYKQSEERRNWTATKRLAKKLDLWNKQFYNASLEYHYTTALQF